MGGRGTTRLIGAGFIAAAFALAAPTFAQTQGQMNQNAGATYKQADAQLNQIYAKLMRNMPDQAKKALAASERAWIKFRDDDCKYESMGAEGGSAYDMVYAGCLADVTRTRIKQLEYQLTCQEGDLSCVSPHG